jgi:CoA:oxalate CoA-transferase
MSGPLENLLIVDLSRVLAGPYATMVLLDLGARVIKVEKPGTGDDSRAIGPFKGGSSAYFTSINRGKESIALDLKDQADRVIFEALLDRADVLVENYRPGVMTKLGYGWDAVHARWPKLIYAAASGFGHTGPYAARAAYDMVVQGMGGIMSVTGHPGGPPTRVGTSVGDITAGLFCVIGIQAALLARSRSGKGQFVDVAMLDCQIAILENAIARYAVSGVAPGPLGARHPSITPFAAFATADRPIIIAAGNDDLWAKLCAALGLEEAITDPRFVSNDDRTTHVDELSAVLESALTRHPVDHWLSVLDCAGVPCGPINDVAQALADPQVAARKMAVRTTMADGSELVIAGNPIKLSGQADRLDRPPAPLLDGDRTAILRELGLVE